MKAKLQQRWLTLGVALAALCFSERGSADVFVNRTLLPPTPENPCPYSSGSLTITSTVTWDANYQNPWGECMQLPVGPPYVFEFPVFVADGATLNVVEIPIFLAQHLDALGGSGLNLLGADITFAQPISIQGTLNAAGTHFSGSGLSFSPLRLFNSPSAMFVDCNFDFSDIGVSTGVLWVTNTISSAPLTIDRAHFTYLGLSTVLVFIDHRAGPLELTNSAFSGANGQGVNIYSATDATLENNSFDGTDCAGTPVGLNCGAPVSFRDSLVRSIAGNTGTSNKINGIVFQIAGNGPARPSATWSTTGDFPLVMMGGDLVINSDQILNLASGTVFKFDTARGIQLSGTLNLLGNSADPVFLTSLNDSSVGGTTIVGLPLPAPGDWTGVEVFGSAPAQRATASFSGCSLRYGGGSSHAAAVGHGHYANTTIFNCTIARNSGPGVAGTVDLGDSINIIESEIGNNVGGGVSLSGYLTSSELQRNKITGNAQGVNVDCCYSTASSDLSLESNQISGNRGTGLTIANVASPFVVNNIISANGQHGIVKQGNFSSTLQLLNNSILGNGGDGVRLQGTSAPVPMANNLIWQNVGFGIAEAPFTIASLPRFNDLFSNGGGIYQRADGTSLSLDEVNMLPGACGNISADPLFGSATSGTSSDLAFDTASDTSTLTDTNATLTPGALVGLSINPSLGQEQQYLVTANTDTTVTVLGDITLVAAIGDAYLVSQPLRYEPASPLADAGDVLTHPLLPPTDFGGRERIIDGGHGPIVDIGAHEFDPMVGN